MGDYLIFIIIIIALGLIILFRFLPIANKQLNEQLTRIGTENRLLNERLDELKQQNEQLKQQSEQLKEDYHKTKEYLIVAQSERKELQNRLEEHQQNKEMMKNQFENLANSIFDKKNEIFRSQSQQNLTNILAPLKENIESFRKKIDDSFQKQNEEQFSLKNEISKIVSTNEEMTHTTTELTKALKSDSKTQGNWGEIVLERILEDSGLRKNDEYTLQGSGFKIKDEQTGRALKPDVIVNLPDGKHIVIDAKVSLTHYTAYRQALQDEDKKVYLKNLVRSIRNHIDSLKDKSYHNSDKIRSPELTIMFMPMENALALAMQAEKNLFHYAWDRKIVIVSPTILFATLRTIASIWVMERGNVNASKIAKQGGLLYDKIAAFIEDMIKIGDTIDKSKNSYDKAMNKLKSGSGNILNRTRELAELGVKAKKSLPQLSHDEIEHQE